MSKNRYSSLSQCHSWSGTSASEHGSLNDLDFSKDGTLLVAGSENNSFYMFDKVSRRLIHTVHATGGAGGVCRVKFLDSQYFATGFFDGTVSLWDTRNLNKRWKVLVAHSRGVRNIEPSPISDCLITSGPDGITCIWEIKKCNEEKELNKDTLVTNPGILLRISFDEMKMVFSTVFGCLMIVHDLHLHAFAEDMDDFINISPKNAYLFKNIASRGSGLSWILTPNRLRNRVEMFTEFPNPGDDFTFTALEMHPRGWSVFSRTVNSSPDRDRIFVHVIKEQPPEVAAAQRTGARDDSSPRPQRTGKMNEERRRGARQRRERSRSPGDIARDRSPLPGPSSAPRLPQEPTGLGNNQALSRVQDSALPRPNPSVAQFKRLRRLTHFAEETVDRKSPIGSLCVSSDGRIVCSPLNGRIRLYAFSPECSEQSVSCGTYPSLLHELNTRIPQTEGVLCTKFSPRERLLVYGCSDGKLDWYKPVV